MGSYSIIALAAILACAGAFTPTLGPVSVSSAACGSRTVPVSTPAQLTAAKDNALAGDTIKLAPGTYTGRWTITRSGSGCARIVLSGPRTAILNGGSVASGTGIWLDGADYWVFRGFTVTQSLVGIGARGAVNVIVDSVQVYNVGQAGIHFREFSSHNILRGNYIHDTGKSGPQYGEGIYIGTANTQWCARTACRPDRSDSNTIERNTIGPNVTADKVDIKPGTTGTIVRGNTMDGRGAYYVSSATPNWVNSAGNSVLVESNTATTGNYHGMRTYIANGLTAWSHDNVYRANRMTVGKAGYAIFKENSPVGMVVYCDNVRTDPGKLSNVRCGV